MKKGWKIFAIVCTSLACCGLILCIIGFAMGATWRDMVIYSDNWDYYGDDDYAQEDEKVGNPSSKEFNNIDAIDVEVHGVSFYIQQYDEKTVKVETATKRRVDCYEEDGTLNIEMPQKRWKWRPSDNEGEIYVYLPRNLKLDEAVISSGAGEIYVDDIKADDLELDAGAAMVEIKNFTANDLSVDVGVGEIILNGTIEADGQIECGTGKVEMVLNGNKEDYNYNVECGIGMVRIEDGEYSGISDKEIKGKGSKNLALDVGLGKIELDFADQ